MRQHFPLSTDKNHGARGRYEARLIDAVTLLFFHDVGADEVPDFIVACAIAQQKAQVMIVLAEETGAELAIGGKPDARAMAAEGLRDGGDEADFAGSSIGEAVFAGGFAALVRDLHKRPASVDALIDFRGRHHEIACPMAVSIQRHEFDKAHDHAALAGKGSERLDLIVVYAANQYSVHFGGRQTRFLSRVDAVHHSRKRFGARDALEFTGIERIEADVDAAEPCGKEAVAAFSQQVAVGSHGEVFDTEGVETADVVLDASPDERLAPGNADFADAQTQEDARQAVEFGPGKNFVVVAVVFRVGGAAVDAAEIATVGDRNAKVGDLAAEFVVKGHGQRCFSDAASWLTVRSYQKKTPDPMLGIGRAPKNSTFSVSSLLSKHGFALKAYRNGRPGRFHPNPQPG